MAAIDLEFETRLAADAERVWEHATSMAGVNYELGPLVRMTAPRRAKELRIDDAPLGEVAFTSVLLAGSVLPIDLHRLAIAEVGPGHRFLERSSSLLQARWEHERWIETEAGRGCRLSDRLAIDPRLRPAAPLTAAIVRRLFERRHRRLRARFG
jgi:hypothetical protein